MSRKIREYCDYYHCAGDCGLIHIGEAQHINRRKIMSGFQSHKNWNHWNVSLWINNDEDLYRLAKGLVDCYEKCGGRDKAAKAMLESLANCGTTKTPDGAPYSVSSIRAAMVGL